MTWIGFTGTRHTPPERMAELITEEIVENLGDHSAFVTGGCRGFDAFIGALMMMRYPTKFHVVVLPDDRSQVAEWWKWPSVKPYIVDGINLLFFEMPPGSSYRARNEKIVELSSCLAVFADYPEDHPTSRRSGTWMTKRIADKRKKLNFEWIIVANP